MNAYLSLIGVRFRALLQYRGAAFAGVVTQVFWGLLRVMIFDAFYSASTRQPPMSRRDMVTYVWLGQALLGLLPWNFDTDVRDLIRNGNVAYEMVRPLDLYTHWFCRAVAQRVAPTLLRCLPIFVLAGLFLGMKFPPSLASGFAWALTTLGAILLNAAFMNLVTISLLWTLSGEGVMRAAPPIVMIFSGMLIPLAFFPDRLQPLLNFLPFRGMVDVPFRAWLGQIPPGQIAPYFLHQLAWTGALALLGRGLLARGTHRLVVEGG